MSERERVDGRKVGLERERERERESEKGDGRLRETE